MLTNKIRLNSIFFIIVLFFLSFFYIDNLYSFDKENYDYSTSGRTLKDDETLDSINDSDATSISLDVLKFIPGVDTIGLPLAYMIQTGIVAGSGSITEVGGDMSAVTGIATAAGTIGDILSPSSMEGNAAISMQQVFKTNQYCQHQLVYVEEEKYVSKQKSTPGGGYPIFPIYPMDIQVNESTWQCDLNDTVIDKYFKNMGILLNPNTTKCTYAYSATRDQCIIELGIPILSEYIAQQVIVESVCLVSGLSQISKEAGEAASEAAKEASEKVIKEAGEEMSEEAIEKAAKEAADQATQKTLKEFKNKEIWKVIELIARVGSLVGVELFFDSKLAFDPIMMVAVINIEFTIQFLFNLIEDLIGQNYACIIARITGIQALNYAAKMSIGITEAVIHGKAKKALKNITFCGYDWLSYAKTEDGKYYSRGLNSKSRFKQVSDCINDTKENNECNSITDTVCSTTNTNSSWCNNIDKKSKDIKNKIFREYIYGGREYDAEIVESNIISQEDNRLDAINYEVEYCIDPRLPVYKGFGSILQRYYMKGNEKANFACNRFFYNKNDGCILLDKDVSSEDKSILKNFTENAKKYYVVDTSNTEMLKKYVLQCKETFIQARKCCEYRSKHLFCLENKENKNNKFCFSNVVKSYGTDALQTNLFTYIANRDADADKITCEIDDYEFEASKKSGTDHICVFSDSFCPYNFKLNAGLNYRASYCDSNYFTNYSDNNGVLSRDTTHNNVAECREGLFSSKMRKNYKKLHSNTGEIFAAFTYNRVREDMASFNYNQNDFGTIYDLDRLKSSEITNFKDDDVKTNYTNDELIKVKTAGYSTVNTGNTVDSMVAYDLKPEYANQIKTSAFGQVKNFCQYRAHCVEVDREFDHDDDFSITSLFLDSSCNGSSPNSRNILQTNNGGVPRQLSAPIVECIYESLKNLINGVAGVSSCASGSSLNSNGYCDNDDKETVEEQLKNNNSLFFEDRYNMVENSYLVKGVELPESYNPFIKIQKYFVNIIKIALCLFLVVYSYRAFFVGDYDIFEKMSDKRGSIVLLFAKFSIVSYLIFSNGWRNGIYDHIVNFSTAGYNFVNNLFIKVVKNPKNQILNINSEDKAIKVVSIDNATNSETDISICYKYDILKNIDFRVSNETLGRCDNGYRNKPSYEILIKKNDNFPSQGDQNSLIISNNQEISRLLYYVDTYNKNNSKQLKLQIKIGNSWSDNLSDGKLWNEYYDGCYFDTTEYESEKSYLSFFDTLDCKMIRYLGYSVNAGAPNVLIYGAIMLLPQFFFPDGKLTQIISGIGSMLFGLIMTFVFLMFNVIIKAVYLFVSSFFILSILIFLSPIILPMMFMKKTKSYYDQWFEYMLGTMFKPTFGLALLILYVNLMDILLIGNEVIFDKHSNIGRGANVICQDGYISFFCMVTKNPVESFDFLVAIFDGRLINLLTSIIIAFLFFKLADSFMDQLNEIIDSIFDIGASSSLSTAQGHQDQAGNTESALNKAMETGSKIEDFRKSYLTDTMVGALNSSSGAIGKTSNFFSNIRTDFNNHKLDKNLKQKENINNLSKRREDIKQEMTKLDGNGIVSDPEKMASLQKELNNINKKIGNEEETKNKLENIDKNISNINDNLESTRKINVAFNNFSNAISFDNIGNRVTKLSKSIKRNITNITDGVEEFSKNTSLYKKSVKTINNLKAINSQVFGIDGENRLEKNKKLRENNKNKEKIGKLKYESKKLRKEIEEIQKDIDEHDYRTSVLEKLNNKKAKLEEKLKTNRERSRNAKVDYINNLDVIKGLDEEKSE